MQGLHLTDAFARYKAKLKNPNWAVSAISDDGAVVISCWAHYFRSAREGALLYVDSLSRWKGHNKAGNDLLREHLAEAFKEQLPVRLVIAHAAVPAAVEHGGDASKIKKTFSIKPELTGKVTKFDGDAFEIEFRRGT